MYQIGCPYIISHNINQNFELQLWFSNQRTRLRQWMTHFDESFLSLLFRIRNGMTNWTWHLLFLWFILSASSLLFSMHAWLVSSFFPLLFFFNIPVAIENNPSSKFPFPLCLHVISLSFFSYFFQHSTPVTSVSPVFAHNKPPSKGWNLSRTLHFQKFSKRVVPPGPLPRIITKNRKPSLAVSHWNSSHRQSSPRLSHRPSIHPAVSDVVLFVPPSGIETAFAWSFALSQAKHKKATAYCSFFFFGKALAFFSLHLLLHRSSSSPSSSPSPWNERSALNCDSGNHYFYFFYVSILLSLNRIHRTGTNQSEPNRLDGVLASFQKGLARSERDSSRWKE